MAGLPALNKMIEIRDLREMPDVLRWASDNSYEMVSTIAQEPPRREYGGSRETRYLVFFRLNLGHYAYRQEAKLLQDDQLEYVSPTQHTTVEYYTQYPELVMKKMVNFP